MTAVVTYDRQSENPPSGVGCVEVDFDILAD